MRRMPRPCCRDMLNERKAERMSQMQYDFETMLRRDDSIKWQLMREQYPDIDDEAIPLTVADMEWRTAPEIREGLKAYLDSTILGYPYVKSSYYEALQGWMRRRHRFAVDKDWIYPVSGVVPALYGAISALTNPLDGVIIMPPVYFPFRRAIQHTGRTAVECPLLNENEQYAIDFDRFEMLAADPANTMFMLCSPHNPGGIVWPKHVLERVAAICLDNDVLVLSDEIHQDLVMPGHTHTVFQTLSEETALITVTCTAPSKTFNLAGMGIANLIMANSEHRKKYEAHEARTGFPAVTILAYKACELAYTLGDAWLDAARLQIDENRKTAEAFFNRVFPEAAYAPMQGTYLLWVDMRHVDAEHAVSHDAKTFIATDGAMFGTGGEGHLRINLALPNDALAGQLRRLAEDYGRL